MIVVTVDAHTGELAAFDRDSGVDLADAVTASCALPGLAPTHSINGARYIDGGVRSPDNADLASGYANVVVLSPLVFMAAMLGLTWALGRIRGPAPVARRRLGDEDGRFLHSDPSVGYRLSVNGP